MHHPWPAAQLPWSRLPAYTILKVHALHMPATPCPADCTLQFGTDFLLTSSYSRTASNTLPLVLTVNVDPTGIT
jgi:hypothetical protein